METYTKRSIRPEVEVQEPEDRHSIAELLRELREESVTLVKQEMALAKSEMKEKAGFFGRNAAYLGIGALIGYAGFVFLLFAGMRLLTIGLVRAGLDPTTAAWLSPAILGVIVLVIGLALVMKAKNAFKAQKLVPEKTIQSIKEETSWTRTKLKEA